MEHTRPDARRPCSVLGASLSCLLVLALPGCAKHADFVEMRQDLSALQKLYDQDHKRQEVMQRRLQALEAKIGVKPVQGDDTLKALEALPQRVQDLTARIKDMETRLARMEEAMSSASVGGRLEEGIRPARPGRTPELQDSSPLIAGTPGITPTSAFNLAYNDYLNGRYELAVNGFQRFLKDFSTSSLVPVAQYWLGESYFSMKDYVRAMQAFERVVTDFPHSEKIPSALYKLGLAAAEAGDAQKARGYLKRVIQDFSTTDEAKLAKNKLADLR